jgi:glutamate synthase domain-containing protein 1/glutamate synthase domain-containing protein 3
MVVRLQDVRKLLESRRALLDGSGCSSSERSLSDEAEGGCGVLGFAANVPLPGRHVLTASRQMHNRGNGKGGGIAAAGLDPKQMRVTAGVLASHYLIQVAYLDPGARLEVERECIDSRFDIAQSYRVETLEDWRAVPGLDVAPPEVVRYFCRVKPDVLARFAKMNALRYLPSRAVEDEYVFQNSFRLNQRYYASLGSKRAFVESHARDMLITKIVGYAEQAVEYYKMDDMTAHVWIAHQRYPTKGRVWHPGGAHPFIGVNEALVHNGDFANYHRVTEYLRQRNIVPQFLTDTEVSVLLFDLWDRVYKYPLEVVIEALAPTSERDFDMLPPDKQLLYKTIQQTHLQGSPDGPWFFIVARSHPDRSELQLLGVTDTSMLRPQVFALYEGGGPQPVQMGMVASERQALNACLRSISAEDDRFQPLADRYWNARGGSYQDGGAFVFTVSREGARPRLVCQNKFGSEVQVAPRPSSSGSTNVSIPLPEGDAKRWFGDAWPAMVACDTETYVQWTQGVVASCKAGGVSVEDAVAALTLARDRRIGSGPKKRSAQLSATERALFEVFRLTPGFEDPESSVGRRIDIDSCALLRSPVEGEKVLFLDASGFDPEGPGAAARLMTDAWKLGWRRFVGFDWRGGRFAGCGLGPDTADTRIDVYGDCGDYFGSGLDGAEMIVHGDAQDQVGQILKSGRLIIHGDVGQTFLYGAKGGSVFVLGSAAGRPLINAVGCPRTVINGTCLDYLAESFMAGDALHGGGFVIVNGIEFDEDGQLHDMETPYPGSNLFSLASGGAIYVRDPNRVVDEGQLNGGRFVPLGSEDWALIEPYLKENEALFGIPVERLLHHEGRSMTPQQVYRKVEVDRP